MKNACSYPGADADTDHNLIIMSQVVTLKKNWKEKENFEMEPRKYGEKG